MALIQRLPHVCDHQEAPLSSARSLFFLLGSGRKPLFYRTLFPIRQEAPCPKSESPLSNLPFTKT